MRAPVQLSSYSDPEILRKVESRRLLYGPYNAPHVRIGDELHCNVYGLQIVAGWSGPKQWPRAKARGGRPRLIICDELRRAIKFETCETVSAHWGIHIRTIAKWRKKLGFESTISVAGSSYKRAKMRRERTMRPDRYVLPGYHAITSLTSAARMEVGRRSAGARAWSLQEIEALRHLANDSAMVQLNRSFSSIMNARARYGIPHPRTRCSCDFCDYEWMSRKERPPACCARCGRKLKGEQQSSCP
jgi:hypothetical protein